jgi:hypothetical protein
MLGIRSAWREDTAFSPAEAVFGAQPVLPGQFLSSPEPPSPSFLQELQQTLNNRLPPATAFGFKITKSANKGKTKFLENIQFGYRKKLTFIVISNPLKKFHKNSHKKSYV